MWHKKEKRGSLYQLLVPLLEAFALPIFVERATQKPTLKYDYNPGLTSDVYSAWEI